MRRSHALRIRAVRVSARAVHRRASGRPLVELCVPGLNIDCEWADGLDTTRANTIITKHQEDAGEADGYRAVVSRRSGTALDRSC